MIQIYSKTNTDYAHNGDMTIFPETCTLEAVLNGTWSMELSHPLDDEGRWQYIEEEAVISAPTFRGTQLFRISSIKKTDDGITATAYPIFYDSADDVMLLDVRPTNATGQEALNAMTAGSRYTGESNITTAATAYFVRRNLMSAISGSEEPTFLGRWGGEILYDNFKVIINSRVGGDYGVEARYGKNITGIEYELDMSEVATRIIPVAYNGRTIGGKSGHVDSPNIGKYGKVYTKEIKFEDVKLKEDASEDGEEEGVIICDDQAALDKALTDKCNEQFEAGTDLPKVSISVDMELLSLTDEYKDYIPLETVGLGDTVNCIHSKLGISTPARVTSLTWDCVRNAPGNIKLGDFKFDYFKQAQQDASGLSDSLSGLGSILDGVVDKDGHIMAEKVFGILDGMNTQLAYQKNIAQKQDVRAILFEDLDPASPTFGALSLGTQGLEISKKRTSDDRDWEWTTAITAAGIYANAVITGLLADKMGHNWWNLDTGEFRLSMATQLDDSDSTLQSAFDSANKAAADAEANAKAYTDDLNNALTQEEVFKRLTKNGALKGIYMEGGELYINASYLKTGILNAALIQAGILKSKDGETFYLDLDGGVLRMKAESLEISGQTVDDIAAGAASSAAASAEANAKAYTDALDDSLTQQDVFNRLTKNGAAKGIILRNGELYISASYINTGTLSASYIKGGTLTLGGSNNANGVLNVQDSSNVNRVQFTNKGAIFRFANAATVQIYSVGDTSDELQTGPLIICKNSYSGSDWFGQYGNDVRTIISYGKIGINGGYTGYNNYDNRVFMDDVHIVVYKDPMLAPDDSARAVWIGRGGITVNGNFTVTGGTKARAVKTPDYETRSQYCYEMPSPMFGDIGQGVTDEDGICYIYLDDVFAETIATGMEYQAFLQKEGNGDLWVDEKGPSYFTVKGTQNLRFAWEVKAVQRDYELERLERYEPEPEPEENDGEINYEADYVNELEAFIEEQEAIYEAA